MASIRNIIKYIGIFFFVKLIYSCTYISQKFREVQLQLGIINQFHDFFGLRFVIIAPDLRNNCTIFKSNSKYIYFKVMSWAGDQTVDWSFSDGLPSSIVAALSLAVSGMGLSHSGKYIPNSKP